MQNKFSLNKAIPLAVGACAWPYISQYTEMGSNLVRLYMHNLGVPPNITSYLAPMHLIGVVATSQIAIKDFKKHSKLSCFIANSVLGILYYAPPALAFGLCETYLGQLFPNLPWSAIEGISIVAALQAGTAASYLVDKIAVYPLDRICFLTDKCSKYIRENWFSSIDIMSDFLFSPAR